MWTFPLRINSGPICTTLSVQSVSVHLSHPAHFLSIGKYRWLSEFQNASVSRVVILAWEWSWKDQSITIHPLYNLHSGKDFPGVTAVTVLCFSAFSSTVGLLPWRLCSEQATLFPLAKPPGHVCWFCFPTFQSSADQMRGWLRAHSAWLHYICHPLSTNLGMAAFISLPYLF